MVNAEKKHARAPSAPEGSSSDSDDMGPMPVPASADDPNAEKERAKRRKILQYEQLYLSQLPNASRYMKSLMHRDTINFVSVTRHTDFVITTSVDGHVKFWKKQTAGIEFVKHYRAHVAMIVGACTSADGAYFATVAADGSVKVFDVLNYDLINMIELKYTPRACCWVHRRGSADIAIAISEENSTNIRFYDGRGDGTVTQTVSHIHREPCHILEYNELFDCLVSADIGGMIEYWQPNEPYELPDNVFKLKSSTDLFEFKKKRTFPTTLTFSSDFSQFATVSMHDRQVRIFSFAKGKLLRQYDESLTAVQEMQQAGTAAHLLDDMEFGRRLAQERDLDATALTGLASATANATGAGTVNAIFDESGHFIIYATMLGIKVINLKTNKLSRLLGKDETIRFLQVSLYQGTPDRKYATSIDLAASENPLVQKHELDPTLFCSAYKRARFYMFTQQEPDNDPNSKLSGGDRDVLNEKPTREEQAVATKPVEKKPKQEYTSATLHTTVGDIYLELFPDKAPKTVENFVGLAKKGYYDGVIFHRVIKKFMLQTGDPLGDGTGGESLWGREFEDEIVPELRHDKPYTLSMANAGPNTNGSQFFITTVPTPWLDDKHTIFGHATGGLEVIHEIEHTPVRRGDRPITPIEIFSRFLMNAWRTRPIGHRTVPSLWNETQNVGQSEPTLGDERHVPKSVQVFNACLFDKIQEKSRECGLGLIAPDDIVPQSVAELNGTVDPIETSQSDVSNTKGSLRTYASNRFEKQKRTNQIIEATSDIDRLLWEAKAAFSSQQYTLAAVIYRRAAALGNNYACAFLAKLFGFGVVRSNQSTLLFQRDSLRGLAWGIFAVERSIAQPPAPNSADSQKSSTWSLLNQSLTLVCTLLCSLEACNALLLDDMSADISMHALLLFPRSCEIHTGRPSEDLQLIEDTHRSIWSALSDVVENTGPCLIASDTSEDEPTDAVQSESLIHLIQTHIAFIDAFLRTRNVFRERSEDSLNKAHQCWKQYSHIADRCPDSASLERYRSVASEFQQWSAPQSQRRVGDAVNDAEFSALVKRISKLFPFANDTPKMRHLPSSKSRSTNIMRMQSSGVLPSSAISSDMRSARGNKGPALLSRPSISRGTSMSSNESIFGRGSTQHDGQSSQKLRSISNRPVMPTSAQESSRTWNRRGSVTSVASVSTPYLDRMQDELPTYGRRRTSSIVSVTPSLMFPTQSIQAPNAVLNNEPASLLQSSDEDRAQASRDLRSRLKRQSSFVN
ncbi:peptidylprolyl isomerase [Malassezia psittaci]|uniref:peptidylprolyl isomerase n=1 Tax=Malassezia psittaci TaxID=1821823 RepID=A0AAF0JEB4_9BASI|nr:peptidylprolyl isomerase [Malassezia psittaci]